MLVSQFTVSTRLDNSQRKMPAKGYMISYMEMTQKSTQSGNNTKRLRPTLKCSLELNVPVKGPRLEDELLGTALKDRLAVPKWETERTNQSLSPAESQSGQGRMTYSMMKTHWGGSAKLTRRTFSPGTVLDCTPPPVSLRTSKKCGNSSKSIQTTSK
jgi:hypothetical protein